MDRIDRYKIEKAQDWRGWIAKIPAIQFDPGWQVQVIPPFSGALARFRVTVGDKAARRCDHEQKATAICLS